MVYPVKHVSILILFFTCLCACKEISFRDPQPNGKKILSSVPKKLQGKYLLTDENGVDTDTLFVTPTGYRIGDDLKHEAFLSDTLVLKYFKGYYFLNIKERPEWYLRVIQKDKNGNLVFMTMENKDHDFPSYINSLSAEIKIDSTNSSDGTLYQINPSPKKLVELIKKGLFKKIVLKKLN